jgi:hypothetical protein
MASTTWTPDSPAYGETYQLQDVVAEAKPGSVHHGSTDTSKLGADGSWCIKEGKKGDINTQPKQMSGHWRIILGHSALSTIPMIGLAAALLALIICFNTTLFNVDQFSSTRYFFLHQIPISALLSLASLSSLLSVLLIPSLLKLSSFLHARDILAWSDEMELKELPTTRGFAVLLRIVNGSPSAYFQAVQRSFQKPAHGRKVIRQAAMLSTVAMVLR